MHAQCAGVLAKALRGAWRQYMKGLVEPMILTGLSETLTKALKVQPPPPEPAAGEVELPPPAASR